jgi:hypothetical protein
LANDIVEFSLFVLFVCFFANFETVMFSELLELSAAETAKRLPGWVGSTSFSVLAVCP